MNQATGPHEYFRLLAAAAIDGEVTPTELVELRAHLQSCGACRADERAMRSDNAWLANQESGRAPRPAVREAVLRVAAGGTQRSRGLGGLVPALATFAIAVGAIWWLGFWRPIPEPGAPSSTPTAIPSTTADPGCVGSPFLAPRVIPTSSTGEVPWSIGSGDMNADGLGDLVVLSVEPGSVGIMLGDGKGGFSQPRPSAPPAPNPLEGSVEPALLVTDLTADGHPDVVVANPTNGTVVVFVGDGSGGLADALSNEVGGRPGQLASGQLGGDANVDLAIADRSGGVLILIGAGDGSFLAAPRVSLGGTPRGLATADVDRDGRGDLVVGHDLDHRVEVLLGAGDGTFGAPLRLEALAASHVSLADVDEDGDLDAILSNSGPDSVSVLLGDGAGSFGAPLVLPLSNGAPGSTVAVDLDADGFFDLVANDGVSGDLAVFMGDGRGSFTLLGRVPAPDGPTGLVAGDFDRDGRPDVATSNANGNSVSVYLNRCGVAAGLR